MAAKKRKSHLEDVQKEHEMDMTPMIDVVFLLIIFFLCIDFKILEAKLPAYLPKDVGSHTDEVEPQEKVRIKIVCDNWGTPIDRPFQSKRKFSRRGSPLLARRKVILDCDTDVRWILETSD